MNYGDEKELPCCGNSTRLPQLEEGGMTGSGRTRAENFDKLLDKGWARAWAFLTMAGLGPRFEARAGLLFKGKIHLQKMKILRSLLHVSWYCRKRTSKTDTEEKKLLNKFVIFAFSSSSYGFGINWNGANYYILVAS